MANTRRYPDLINELAIICGETWRNRIILYSAGDKTDWSIRGQLRTDLVSNSGELLLDFEFEESHYDSDTNETEFYPLINKADTKLLVPTKYQGDGVLKVPNARVVDFEIEFEGVVEKLAWCYAQVIGEVTDES